MRRFRLHAASLKRRVRKLDGVTVRLEAEPQRLTARVLIDMGPAPVLGDGTVVAEQSLQMQSHPVIEESARPHLHAITESAEAPAQPELREEVTREVVPEPIPEPAPEPIPEPTPELKPEPKPKAKPEPKKRRPVEEMPETVTETRIKPESMTHGVTVQRIRSPQRRRPREKEDTGLDKPPPPPPKPLKVMRRRREGGTVVFETPPKAPPPAMLKGLKIVTEEEE